MDEKLQQETAARLNTHANVASVAFVDPRTAKVSIRVEFAQDDRSSDVSSTGVRAVEDVLFVFDDDYPFAGISFRLRSDFPRDSPHVNPSENEVIPCVFEGKVSELLQQPKGILGVVDQLVDWLNKAAVGGLMNRDQGWEYMRVDRSLGSVYFPLTDLRKRFASRGELRCLEIYGCHVGDYYLGRFPDLTRESVSGDVGFRSACLFCVMDPDDVCDVYCPCAITTFKELQKYLKQQLKIDRRTFEQTLERSDHLCWGRQDLVVIAGVRRPYHLIGSDSKIEFLGFHVDVSNRDDGNRIRGSSKVEALALPEYATPELTRRLSGHGKEYMGRIIQLGCGSLGSKIAAHLARNGNAKFTLVDNAAFLPHNNARHACVSFWGEKKIDVVKRYLSRIGVEEIETQEDFRRMVLDARCSDVIIDSMATISGRNWLANCECAGHIVHTALYNHGKCGLLLIEGEDRLPRIDDLFLNVMRSRIPGVCGKECPIEFAADDFEDVNLGQGCSSYTTVLDDSTISLHAAGMSIRIQKCLEDGFPANGVCAFSKSDGEGSVKWESIAVGKTYVCEESRPDGFKVRVLACAIDDVREEQKRAGENETGGVLCAAVNEMTRTITVVACLPPPPDSKADGCSFMLGTAGVKDQIRQIQSASGNVLTSVGTWHTHPHGGSASLTDRKTYETLFTRRRFPTLCMIWKPDGTLEFLPDDK